MTVAHRTENELAFPPTYDFNIYQRVSPDPPDTQILLPVVQDQPVLISMDYNEQEVSSSTLEIK